jgi:hypothetical protein
MLLYIAATKQVVSSALVIKRAEDAKENGVQRPVYYLSEVLSPTKKRLSKASISEASICYKHDREEIAALL